MRQYALQQTGILLHRFGDTLQRAAREVDAGAIHDLRVSMRRLSRCLRVFAPFYPERSWKRIRRHLSALMAMAGAVRDCDIALELLEQAGVSPRSAVMLRLRAERHKEGHELLQEVRRWMKRELLHKWSRRLEL